MKREAVQQYPEIDGETDHERAMRKIAEATLDGLKSIARNTDSIQQQLQVIVLIAVLGLVGGLAAVVIALN